LNPETIRLFIELGALVVATKLLVSFCSRVGIAPVFAMVIFGAAVGPGLAGWVHDNEFLRLMGEIGVFMLLFLAGLETDVPTMKKAGRLGAAAAVGGVTLPLMGGFFLGKAFGFSTSASWFIGTIMTATSVSVTIMTLWELDKLKTLLGSGVLSGAILDDIISIIVLSVVLSLSRGAGGVGFAIGKMIGFLALAALLGFAGFPWLMRRAAALSAPQSVLALAFGVMFLYCGLAQLCGVAPITGAYIAGLFLGFTSAKRQILEGTEVVGHSLFIPLFFVTVGLEARFGAMGGSGLFLGLFVITALATKIAGCGVAGRLCGLSKLDSLRLGVGMMPRGEVALAVARLGMAAGFIGHVELNATLALVVVSSAVAPQVLRLLYRREET